MSGLVAWMKQEIKDNPGKYDSPAIYPDDQEEPTSAFDVLLREAFDAGWDSRAQQLGGEWQVNEGFVRRKAWAAYRSRLGTRSRAR